MPARAVERYRISGKSPSVEDDGVLVGILTRVVSRVERHPRSPRRYYEQDLVAPPVSSTLARSIRGDPPRRSVDAAPGSWTAALRARVNAVRYQRLRQIKYSDATKDDRGRLAIGAPWTTFSPTPPPARCGPRRGRGGMLVVDTAHGHSHGVLDVVRRTALA